MGKAKGFIEIDVKEPDYRDVKQRLKDFKEVERVLNDEEIQEQAARCMDCGIPFCHGCGCPLGNLIPEWNEYVYRGFWKLALNILLSTNDFPEFTGRICPAPCETACTAGISSSPVSIRQIEVALVEKGFASDYISSYIPKKRTDKKVAVIGSGPSGLSAANQLNKLGHNVTIYERDKFPGGLLRYGIPDFKLDKRIIERRIKLMGEQGIKFETGIDVGSDITAKYLLKKFDAICLASGARKPRDLNIPGKMYDNIYFALDFLTMQNKEVSNEEFSSNKISVRNKKVVVIGGGDTGSDCVGTSNRQSASSVTQIEIMPKPPEIRSEGTPWPEWSYKLRTSSSHKEGCERLWSVMSKSFEGVDGKVSKINAVKVEWEFSERGLPVAMKEIPGTEFSIEADVVFLSMGFIGPEKMKILKQLEVEQDKRTNVIVNELGNTGLENVFATGDIVSGASLVVRALEAGKITARHIDNYLLEK
ncbi:MAG TPA: glutamate synthase subunit beta [Victivallales bacterium]|nr:glutamate synthase subunit beta [Victivallales bacterium]